MRALRRAKLLAISCAIALGGIATTAGTAAAFGPIPSYLPYLALQASPTCGSLEAWGHNYTAGDWVHVELFDYDPTYNFSIEIGSTYVQAQNIPTRPYGWIDTTFTRNTMVNRFDSHYFTAIAQDGTITTQSNTVYCPGL